LFPQFLQLRDGLLVATEPELDVEPLLDQGETEFGQASGRARREVLVRPLEFLKLEPSRRLSGLRGRTGPDVSLGAGVRRPGTQRAIGSTVKGSGSQSISMRSMASMAVSSSTAATATRARPDRPARW
jgi:hypothetical protein